MVPVAYVRQFAAGQHVDVEVADLEIVLVYALSLLNEAGLTGLLNDGGTGPLLFKGGTALRKCVFGSIGRFSRDLDFDAAHHNGFEAELERVIQARQPFFDIRFSIEDFRYSADYNFSESLVRRMAVLKCWTDGATRFEPEVFLDNASPENYFWDDLLPLIPGGRERDPRVICRVVRDRFRFLRDCDPEEVSLLNDWQAHREQARFEQLCAEALTWAPTAAR